MLPKSWPMFMTPLIAGPRHGSGLGVYPIPPLYSPYCILCKYMFEIGNKRMLQLQLSLAQDKTIKGRELRCHLPRDIMLITWSLFFPADIAISGTWTLTTEENQMRC